MTYPEHTTGWEPATSRELNDLYYKTMGLVKKIGVYTVDPDVEVPQHEGLPITNDAPRYDLSVSADEVWQISPWAAGTLKLGGPLELMYIEHCYAPLWGGGLAYEKPSCAFKIHYSEDSSFSYKFWEITLSGTGEADSGGHYELRDKSRDLSHMPKEGLLMELAAKLELESQTGIDKMTSAECQALLEIVKAKALAA